jgi:hypothetical protein
MQLQTVNRTDAEKIFGNFTNAHGATMTTGYPVCFTTTAASVDGNLAVLPATNNLRTFAGVTDSDVADNATGRYQSYGYNGSVFFFAEATSVSVTTPDHAAGPAAASLGVGYTGTTVLFGPVIVLESVGAVVRSAGGYVIGFIRAL